MQPAHALRVNHEVARHEGMTTNEVEHTAVRRRLATEATQETEVIPCRFSRFSRTTSSDTPSDRTPCAQVLPDGVAICPGGHRCTWDRLTERRGFHRPLQR